MTKKGLKALRRRARARGWTDDFAAREAVRIDKLVDQLMAEYPACDDSDREWLEAAVVVPTAAGILLA